MGRRHLSGARLVRSIVKLVVAMIVCSGSFFGIAHHLAASHF